MGSRFVLEGVDVIHLVGHGAQVAHNLLNCNLECELLTL